MGEQVLNDDQVGVQIAQQARDLAVQAQEPVAQVATAAGQQEAAALVPWGDYVSPLSAKIEAIRKLQAHTTEHVRRAAPKIYSHELVELIFELPYCRIQNLTQRDIAQRQTASVYLKELVRLGVLEEKAVGREKLSSIRSSCAC